MGHHEIVALKMPKMMQSLRRPPYNEIGEDGNRTAWKNVHSPLVTTFFQNILGGGDICEDNETASQSRQGQGLIEEPLSARRTQSRVMEIYKYVLNTGVVFFLKRRNSRVRFCSIRLSRKVKKLCS